MVKFKGRILDYLLQSRNRLIFMASSLTVLALATALIYSSINIVTVQDSQKNKKVILSVFPQQEQLLALAHMSPDKDDTVMYTSFSDNYRNITIKRGFSVAITVDGSVVETTITDGTVKKCLEQAGVLLGEHDYTVPSLNSQIQQGDTITVYRVEYRDTQYEEDVPFKVEYKANSLIYRFKNRQYTLREGSKGKNLVTYRERYVNGEMESSLISKVEVVKKPTSALVLKYAPAAISPLSAPAGVTISNNVPSRYSSVISNVAATGYSASGGKGASGLGLFCGSVAVNPNIIPYGSKLYITSPDGQFVYGFAIATDTGSALMEGIIGVDLFYETYKESAMNWKNTVNIYIIE